VVVPRDVEIYPGDDRLVVEVAFTASLPRHVFDVSGRVWFTGRPVPEAAGQRLRIADIAVTRQIDSRLWRALSLILSEGIPGQLAREYVVDLAPSAARAIREVEKAIGDSSRTNGVELHLASPSLRLGRVVTGRDRMTAEGLFDASIEANLGEIRL
jgi:hypothetical protein